MDHRRRPSRPILALGSLVVALLAAGCVSGVGAGPGGTATPPSETESPSAPPSSAPPSSAPPAIQHPTGAQDLVFRVQTVGGFVAPTYRLTAYPTISIYGDGSVITQGPQIEIYPGPLMPNLLVRHISQAGLERLLDAAKQEGLLEKAGRFDTVGIADAGTTELTFVTDVRHTISAYALGEQTDDSALDPATASVRASMRRFVSLLSDLSRFLGEDVLDAEQPYEAASVRLYVTPGAPQADQGLSQAPKPWPLPTPLAAFGEPFASVGTSAGRCGVVSGSDLATLLPSLRAANTLTPWKSGGSTFGVIAHPLLPGESGCATEG